MSLFLFVGTQVQAKPNKAPARASTPAKSNAQPNSTPALTRTTPQPSRARTSAAAANSSQPAGSNNRRTRRPATQPQTAQPQPRVKPERQGNLTESAARNAPAGNQSYTAYPPQQPSAQPAGNVSASRSAGVTAGRGSAHPTGLAPGHGVNGSPAQGLQHKSTRPPKQSTPAASKSSAAPAQGTSHKVTQPPGRAKGPGSSEPPGLAKQNSGAQPPGQLKQKKAAPQGNSNQHKPAEPPGKAKKLERSGEALGHPRKESVRSATQVERLSSLGMAPQRMNQQSTATPVSSSTRSADQSLVQRPNSGKRGTTGARSSARKFTDVLIQPAPATITGSLRSSQLTALLQEVASTARKFAHGLGQSIAAVVLPTGSKAIYNVLPSTSGNGSPAPSVMTSGSPGGAGASALAIVLLLMYAHLHKGRGWFRLNLLTPGLVPQIPPERPD
ncbi:hypothetical protein BH23PAT1_BH23PAT1_0620 [soil metagenome]